MPKREGYQENLVLYLRRFFEESKIDSLTEYLVRESNLPGPRANLELADALVDAVQDYQGADVDGISRLSDRLREFTSDRAPVNDPTEFLFFCGVRLLGIIGILSPADLEGILSLLRTSAADSRWRVRESVAMTLQMLLERDGRILGRLEGWVKDEDWFSMRAVAAGVAEPKLMRNRILSEGALKLHSKIIARFAGARELERKTDGFRALKKTLGFSLSVVICGAPTEGFDYLTELASSSSEDSDVAWIVRENLKKDRILANFPDKVRSVRAKQAS